MNIYSIASYRLGVTCSSHLTKLNVHHQVLKLHIEDPGLYTEVTKPSQEMAPPPSRSGISPVHVGLMASAVALSAVAVMLYLKRSQLWFPFFFPIFLKSGDRWHSKLALPSANAHSVPANITSVVCWTHGPGSRQVTGQDCCFWSRWISGRRACLCSFILHEREQFHDYGVMSKHYICVDCSFLCVLVYIDKPMNWARFSRWHCCFRFRDNTDFVSDVQLGKSALHNSEW